MNNTETYGNTNMYDQFPQDEPEHLPETCSECGCELTAQESGRCSVCYRHAEAEESR